MNLHKQFLPGIPGRLRFLLVSTACGAIVWLPAAEDIPLASSVAEDTTVVIGDALFIFTREI